MGYISRPKTGTTNSPTSCIAAFAARSGVTPLVCGLQTQHLGLAVGCPTFTISPKITPEMISEGQKSKIFMGGHAPRPPSRCAMCALIAYWNPPLQLHLLCITSSDWNLLMGTVSMIDVVLLFPTSFDAVTLNSNRLQLASSGS